MSAKRTAATFHGKPCRKCGGTERYAAASKACVNCQRLRITKKSLILRFGDPIITEAMKKWRVTVIYIQGLDLMSKDTPTEELHLSSKAIGTSSSCETKKSSGESESKCNGSPEWPQWRLEEIARKYSEKDDYYPSEEGYVRP